MLVCFVMLCFFCYFCYSYFASFIHIWKTCRAIRPCCQAIYYFHVDTKCFQCLRNVHARVRTRFPFFVRLLNCCCCCCCHRYVKHNLSGWKISIYQSKNVACKIPFGKISCHFQINDAQIYSSLSLLLSHSHQQSAVKCFLCEMPPLRGRKSPSLCNFCVSYFTRPEKAVSVDAHG